LDIEEFKTISLQSLTESHTEQINSNDHDLLVLKFGLHTEEPKIVSLQSLTASHTEKINSNDDDLLDKKVN
jgi:hypothetical protein